MTFSLIESDPITFDEKCKFCKEHGTADKNLNSEIESLLKIKEKMNTNASFIWRFATKIGEPKDQQILESGWILEDKTSHKNCMRALFNQKYKKH